MKYRLRDKTIKYNTSTTTKKKTRFHLQETVCNMLAN